MPTIQRMEASEGVIRGTVDSLMKLAALDAAGIELIGEGAAATAVDAACDRSRRGQVESLIDGWRQGPASVEV
ncbi:MAG TPA: hypothetical protein VKK81_22690 [Candidatus Binatia bacterium]|nr:hypothetical protein [Candidatus Binatia bacterium]